MPSRTITTRGKTWSVFPSGRITQYDRDEFGLVFVAGVGAELGVRIVRGVELSAVEGDSETHILGLHLSDASALEAHLVGLREMRRTRAERIVVKLNDLGVRIELTAVLEQAAGGAIGRP